MKITYDSDVDAMYIQLLGGHHQCRTVRLTDDVALDFGAGERLVGIEILDARKVLGKGKMPRVVLDNIVPASLRMTARAVSRTANKGRARKAG